MMLAPRDMIATVVSSEGSLFALPHDPSCVCCDAVARWRGGLRHLSAEEVAAPSRGGGSDLEKLSDSRGAVSGVCIFHRAPRRAAGQPARSPERRVVRSFGRQGALSLMARSLMRRRASATTRFVAKQIPITDILWRAP